MPNGSLAPCTTSVGTLTASSSGRRLGAGFVRRGGTSGNARQRTPIASVASAVRQATRAPSERPPTINGTPRSWLSRRSSTTAVHAASSCFAGAGERRPATRYGCSTRATVRPSASAASRAVTRSRDSTPPPAPWPSTRAAFALFVEYTCALAAPCGVSISTTAMIGMLANPYDRGRGALRRPRRRCGPGRLGDRDPPRTGGSERAARRQGSLPPRQAVRWRAHRPRAEAPAVRRRSRRRARRRPPRGPRRLRRGKSRARATNGSST